MKSYFIRLFRYDHWAMNTLLEAFDKQQPGNSRIFELVSHMLSTQRIWLDRCLSKPDSVQRFQERTAAAIKSLLSANHHEWISFIEQLPEDEYANMITYKTSTGEVFSNTVQDIITQVINHGTHHRGSIISMMKEEGYALPALDYIFFIRRA